MESEIILNDADGEDMLFGGAVIESGPSSNWLVPSPKNIYRRTYSSASKYALVADNKAFVPLSLSNIAKGVFISTFSKY